jgi:5-methylcytosine-specific restriction protein A
LVSFPHRHIRRSRWFRVGARTTLVFLRDKVYPVTLLQAYRKIIPMPPTIRIDEEVYAWLQTNARPFEDTPNSVLRRIAGLDKQPQPAADAAPNNPQTRLAAAHAKGRLGLMGKQLNEEWNVGARHALFSRDGTWYENLEKFPGALFDQNGYIIFANPEEYRSNPNISIGKKTNVRAGISSLPGYVRKTLPKNSSSTS